MQVPIEVRHFLSPPLRVDASKCESKVLRSERERESESRERKCLEREREGERGVVGG